MKTRKLRGLAALLFSLSLALGTGVALSRANKSESAQIVLAEEDEEPVDSVGSGDSGEIDGSGDSEEPAEPIPEETDSGEGKEESSTEEKEEEKSESGTTTVAIDVKELLMAVVYAFRDAFLDLVAHIKSWLKLN